MSDTEKQLRECREMLKAVVTTFSAYRAIPTPIAIMEVMQQTENYLKATEPKHAAEVAWEEWCMGKAHVGTISDYKIAMHFYRVGMLNVADMVNAEQLQTARAQRIRDAAEKVPV